ncbi:MAG TPA: hypothetical protein H9769_05970 [Candidatus Microbacterium pullistercoris]|nr:hypothetical protein [Candidatus Microbacterium pullistercoris]
MSISSGWAERMPWQRSVTADAPLDAVDGSPRPDGVGDETEVVSGDRANDVPQFVSDDLPEIASDDRANVDLPGAHAEAAALPDAPWPLPEGAANAVGERLPAGVEPATAERWARQASTPEGRREALNDIGVHMSAEYAERAGLDIDPAGVDASVRALATDEGRVAAMRELGVHMSGNLAERYGIEDAEAARLLESSRALRTPEGRRALMAEYTDGADSDLMRYITGRGDSIGDRREAVQKLLQNDRLRAGAGRLGRGLLVGGIVLIVVLVGILVGAVALLGSLFDGGADTVAHAATRPTIDWIGAGLVRRVM